MAHLYRSCICWWSPDSSRSWLQDHENTKRLVLFTRDSSKTSIHPRNDSLDKVRNRNELKLSSLGFIELSFTVIVWKFVCWHWLLILLMWQWCDWTCMGFGKSSWKVLEIENKFYRTWKSFRRTSFVHEGYEKFIDFWVVCSASANFIIYHCWVILSSCWLT